MKAHNAWVFFASVSVAAPAARNRRLNHIFYCASGAFTVNDHAENSTTINKTNVVYCRYGKGRKEFGQIAR